MTVDEARAIVQSWPEGASDARTTFSRHGTEWEARKNMGEWRIYCLDMGYDFLHFDVRQHASGWDVVMWCQNDEAPASSKADRG